MRGGEGRGERTEVVRNHPTPQSLTQPGQLEGETKVIPVGKGNVSINIVPIAHNRISYMRRYFERHLEKSPGLRARFIVLRFRYLSRVQYLYDVILF